MVSRRYRVTGRVQRVGFRMYTWQSARAVGVRGFVRNLPDGSVEALAEGTEANLERFEAFLERGPSGSRVDAVESKDCESPGVDGFEIRE